MTWILEGVDPSEFNLWASIIAEILQLGAGYVLSQFYSWVLSEYLRRGNKIPVEAVGQNPSGIVDAVMHAKIMKL
eukprot:CAMPEP_0194250332 /NCGR_PEP_ID=MMETSP0158-20130606/22763_1 /TAXON_ID=33649 /ORGANISM="Thalassionema nitzschioides, Strain L26-B" /LENGTH=74 /DNA_ID=CAMNT_0038987103 /DNA_START=29 /DNA_END=250 /DNA_ORIENTATION=-